MIIYALIINVFGFFIIGLDKEKAKRNRWRIKEGTIFTIAFLGGAIGILLSMKIFHHKTKKPTFKYGMPIVLILNTILYAYIYTMGH